MKRGKRPGSPKTGGRKKGSKNKRTRELLEKAEAGGQSAIDYMLEVMRDNKNDTSLRLDAAKAVAPISMPGEHRRIEGAIPCQR